MFLDDQIIQTVKELTSKRESAAIIKANVFNTCIDKLQADQTVLGFEKALHRVNSYFDVAANKLSKQNNTCIKVGQFNAFVNSTLKIAKYL